VPSGIAAVSSRTAIGDVTLLLGIFRGRIVLIVF